MSEAKPHIPLPSRESVIASQVQTLLNVCHTLAPFVLWRDGVESGGVPKDHPEGIEKIVSATLATVCDRITEIVRDSSRWGMEGQAKLEAALAEMYDANTKLLEANRYAVRLASAPMGQFKPTLGRTPDGKCFAVFGDLNVEGSYILGIGDTMEEAIQSFNAQFRLKPAEMNIFAPEPVVDAEIVKETPNYTKRPKSKRKL